MWNPIWKKKFQNLDILTLDFAQENLLDSFFLEASGIFIERSPDTLYSLSRLIEKIIIY